MHISSQQRLSDWQQVRLGKIGSFSKGSGISKKELSEKGLGAVRYGELYTVHNIQIKKLHSYINDDVAQKATQISQNDILFAGSGETIDEIGKSAVYLGQEKAYAGGDIVIFSPKKDNGLFLALLLNSISIRKQLRRFGQGQSVVHIYKKDLAKLEISLPPLPEQKRIVAVLETWDKAIDLLEKKVELKEQLKKGLMQQLLTGKKRLPGFGGIWRDAALGDIADIKGGNGFPLKYQGKSSGRFPFFKVSDMNHDQNSIQMIESNHWVDNEEVSKMRARVFPIDTVIFAKIGAAIFLERKRILTQPSCIDNNLMGLILNRKKCDVNFFLQLLLIKRLGAYARTTSLPSISSGDLSEMAVSLPSLEEQCAISKVLGVADYELGLLQSKLKDVKKQKTFLLNNLVTGKIRTPGDMKICQN